MKSRPHLIFPLFPTVGRIDNKTKYVLLLVQAFKDKVEKGEIDESLMLRIERLLGELDSSNADEASPVES